MGVLYARETPNDTFEPVSTMGVGLASQSQAGLMSVLDKVKLDGVADYIVEEGTDGIWTYRKWNSGTAECWGEQTNSGTLSQWGVLYSHDIPAISFPTGLFNSPPVEIAQAVSSGGNGIGTMTGSSYSKDTTHALIFVRPVESSGTWYFRIFRYAIGTWK